MPSHPPSPRASLPCNSFVLSLIPLLLALPSSALAHVAPSLHERAPNNNPLNINWDPAPAPEDGPPASAGALRDKSYLPAQIGAIVGAYAFSLVLVAITLLCLAKKRREHLKAANDEADFETEYIPDSKDTSAERFDPTAALNAFTSYDHIHKLQTSSSPDAPGPYVPNFSYPSPTRAEFNDPGPYIHPSPISSTIAPGVNYQVDQRVVAADKAMAQQQLEEMYRHVMEHEEAKQKGTALEPPIPAPVAERYSTSDSSTKSTISKKEKNKPANLNLAGANEEKTQSRTSSLFSALRSPKKKTPKGVSISSPIMTPQSGTFPRQESQEMGGIPPRQYAPPPPPPVPGIQPVATSPRHHGAPITPDISPQSVQTIDERIAIQVDLSQPRVNAHNRNISQAPTEYDPESATSMHSSAPLVGLPASPRSTSFKQSLPSSPKPGMSFSRPNPPSAVRAGGSLPLRAYEAPLASPSAQTTKQTVFERKGPLSPTSGRTPFTAGAAPYSPYQPHTPVVPMTPSLVTKEDRKRMKRLVPKTPTMQMVESSEDTW